MDNYDLQVDVGKRIFLQYDQQRLIEKYHLHADSQWIYLSYLHTPLRISRTTGTIEQYESQAWSECRSYSTVMTVYDLLCYHTGEVAPVLSGKWCAVGSFIVAGITKTEGFTGKYAQKFSGKLPALRCACRQVGGVFQPSMAGADLTCLFPVTSFFSVLLQFWEGDDEFPPKLLVLWDGNTDRFMHFETTFYLQGDLLERLSLAVDVLHAT